VQAINRRKFVATTGVMAAGLAVLGYRSSEKVANNRGMIRLQAVEGVVYSESFTRFMKRAKFDSVRDAIASIRDRSIQVRITHI
jgi:hypothetical protein